MASAPGGFLMCRCQVGKGRITAWILRGQMVLLRIQTYISPATAKYIALQVDRSITSIPTLARAFFQAFLLERHPAAANL
jgi:hypothetical protein